MISLSLLLLFCILSVSLGHIQPGMNYSISDPAACNEFLSYHIHTLFWPSNKNSTANAENLQVKFMNEFGLTTEKVY